MWDWTAAVIIKALCVDENLTFDIKPRERLFLTDVTGGPD